MVHKTTVTREIAITVTATWHKAIRGYRNSFGMPEEPDEPAGWEIEDISGPDGTTFELTDDELYEIESELNSMRPERDWD